MKKRNLLLLTLVPVAVGYLVNDLIAVPVIGSVSFFALPLLATAFWFYLGRQYARSKWKTLPAILAAHAVGITSLVVYLWQFLIETDQTRNLSLAAFSQMFSASTPMYLFGGLARLFESQPDYSGRATFVAMQVIALLYMMAIFGAAMYSEKRKGA